MMVGSGKVHQTGRKRKGEEHCAWRKHLGWNAYNLLWILANFSHLMVEGDQPSSHSRQRYSDIAGDQILHQCIFYKSQIRNFLIFHYYPVIYGTQHRVNFFLFINRRIRY